MTSRSDKSDPFNPLMWPWSDTWYREKLPVGSHLTAPLWRIGRMMVRVPSSISCCRCAR